MVYEKLVEIRWRDADALQHVNNAVYLTYLEEGRDGWVVQALGEIGSAWDYVLARTAIDFRRELTLDHKVARVTVELVRIGSSSVTLKECVHLPDGSLAAEAESVIVRRNPETGRSQPLLPAERAQLERALPGGENPQD